MINPEKVTNYDLDDCGLEEMILFWVCAAGKNGRTASMCLDKFLKSQAAMYQDNTPFKAILTANALFDLPELLKSCGIGCYKTKAKAFLELAVASQKGLNLRNCTVSDLESIYGIGPKTARCFLLHSRSSARVAGLDVHILRYLSSLGHDVPKSTPTGKKYLELEQIFLELADEAGKSPAEFDLEIWNEYSVKVKDFEKALTNTRE